MVWLYHLGAQAAHEKTEADGLKFLKFFGVLLYIIMVVWEIFEFLALPLLFIAIGVLNQLPSKYYIISIGAYLIVYGLVCLLVNLIGRAFGKKVELFIGSRIKNTYNRYEENKR